MALITCPECKASISDQAPTCPQCGLPEPLQRIEMLKAQQKAKLEDWRRKTAWQKYPEFLLFAAFVALVFLFAIFFAVVSKFSGTSQSATSTGKEDWLSDVDAMSICDELVRKRLNNPSTLETLDFDIKTAGNIAIVERDFTAMNGFGAQLDHYYRCRIDLQNHTLVDLQIFQGGR